VPHRSATSRTTPLRPIYDNILVIKCVLQSAFRTRTTEAESEAKVLFHRAQNDIVGVYFLAVCESRWTAAHETTPNPMFCNSSSLAVWAITTNQSDHGT
jgi:hypothetical protein